MSLSAKIRRGEGPLWSRLKAVAKRVLEFHLPITGSLRPLARCAYRLHVCGRETAAFTLRFFWYEPLFRGQCVSVGERFYMERLPYLSGDGRIIVGNGVRLSGKSSIAFSNRAEERPQFVVGDSTFIGDGCGFRIACSLKIGRHCLIAGQTLISDFDGHPVDYFARRSGQPTPQDQIEPVSIGDDVWIGAGSTILKGVRIGDRTIVAARSVVTKDVPPDVIIAGNPAKVVRQLAASSADSAPGGQTFDSLPIHEAISQCRTSP